MEAKDKLISPPGDRKIEKLISWGELEVHNSYGKGTRQIGLSTQKRAGLSKSR